MYLDHKVALPDEHEGPVEGTEYDDVVRGLSALILAGERYRSVLAVHVGMGVTELQALSYLTVHGDRGQKGLADDLGLTSGAGTALVDRLEKQGVAERYPHPQDRRRHLIRMTSRGHDIVEESRQWLGAALRDIGPDDLGQVAAMLRRVADRLRDRSVEIEVADAWSRGRA